MNPVTAHLEMLRDAIGVMEYIEFKIQRAKNTEERQALFAEQAEVLAGFQNRLIKASSANHMRARAEAARDVKEQVHRLGAKLPEHINQYLNTCIRGGGGNPPQLTELEVHQILSTIGQNTSLDDIL